MALFSLLMALLSFYCSAELPLAGFPTQAQECVNLFKKNFLKSRFIVWQRKVRGLQLLYQEHGPFHFQVKHGQCLSVLWIATQLFAYKVWSSPGSQSPTPLPQVPCFLRHPNTSGSFPRILRVQESI